MSKKVKQGVTLRHRRRRIQATWPHYITSTAAETRIPIIPQLEMYNASRRLLKNLISQAGEYIPFERQRILTMMISWPLHYATKRICNWIKVDISTGQNNQQPKYNLLQRIFRMQDSESVDVIGYWMRTSFKFIEYARFTYHLYSAVGAKKKAQLFCMKWYGVGTSSSLARTTRLC